MPSKGHFVLHSRAVPPLKRGDYELRGEQQIGDGDDYPTETYSAQLRVTSPYYRLPPDQILSTFPPANAVGAFESRLPQIVLKRRTLPWEVEVDDDENIPWLALVVIAEGEGSIVSDAPVAQCVTPGVTLQGTPDVSTGSYLSVPRTTVQKVFPTKDDLQLLCHVREVDVNDTELAINDDDGFLAVVMANRLPQFDRQECKPVRYLACLINLEGQLDALPPPSSPVDTFFPGELVFDAQLQAAFFASDTDHVLMQVSEQLELAPEISADDSGSSNPAAARQQNGLAQNVSTRSAANTPATSHVARSKAGEWQLQPSQIEELAVSSKAVDTGELVRQAMTGGFRIPLEAFVLEEPVLRFPVLSHWSFTCDGGGSFASLMRNLDVGMLGTVAGRPKGPPPPECFEPPAGDAPPDVEPARAPAELAETGHVGLPHLTRRGEDVDSWYRGPLVPLLTTREDADDLSHVSDQLRRLIPDGREDLSQASAFEIGRLLALARPSVVAALMRWRREQFGAARARKLSDFVLDRVQLQQPLLGAELIDTLGPGVNRGIIVTAAQAPERVFGDSRPYVDPGRPLDLPEEDLASIVAAGFGLETGSVRQALSTGDISVLQSTSVPRGDVGTPEPDEFTHLREGLDLALERLTDDSLAESRPGAASASTRATSSTSADTAKGERELDSLLRKARTRVRREIDR